MLLPCLTAWAAWVAWAACTRPPRSPRFRLNKKGPASGGAFFCIWRLPGRWSGPATPWKQQGRLLPARPEGGRKHRLPLWAPFPTGLFCKGTRLRACRQGAVLKWQAAFLSRPGCRMRPPFPALRRGNRAWAFPSLMLPARGYKKAASLLQLTACVFCGAPEEIRTPGLQVRSLLLYPAELRARCEDVLIEKRTGCQRFSPVITFF